MECGALHRFGFDSPARTQSVMSISNALFHAEGPAVVSPALSAVHPDPCLLIHRAEGKPPL